MSKTIDLVNVEMTVALLQEVCNSLIFVLKHQNEFKAESFANDEAIAALEQLTQYFQTILSNPKPYSHQVKSKLVN